MVKEQFTKEQVLDGAKARYKKAVCIDMLEEAMNEQTLEDAIVMILLDSAMWDSPSGDPLDLTNIIES